MPIDLPKLRPVICAAAIALATIVLPSAGFTQGASDKEQAQKVYKKGTQAYFQGDYSDSILFFRRAYDLDPNAMPLYNIAVAYGKLGNFEEAYKAGIEAREEGGLPKGVNERNEARIAAFSLVLTSRSLAEAGPAKASVSRSAQVEVSPPRGQKADRPESDERSLSTLGWAGVVGIGAGAAGLGLAGYYALEVDEAQAAFEDSPAPTHSERVTRADEINEMRQIGRLSLYAGAALAVGGVALLTYDLFGGEQADADAARVSAAASSAPGGAKLELRVEF